MILMILYALVSVAVFFVAVYFHKSNPASVALFVLLCEILFIFNKEPSRFYIAMSLGVVVVFGIFGTLKEKGVFNRSGAFKFILVVIIFALTCAFANSGIMIDLYTSKVIFMVVLGALMYIFTAGSETIVALHFESFHESMEKIANMLHLVSQMHLLVAIIVALILFVAALRRKKQGFIFLIAMIVAVIAFAHPFSTRLQYVFGMLSLSLLIVGFSVLRQTYIMAFIDALTGVPTRRALEEYIPSLTHPFSLCMSDIDHFKSFNDTYGHDTGDEVLCFIAKELKKTSGGAKLFRYGGEEFMLIFEKAYSKDVIDHLEKTRKRIADLGFNIRQKNRPKDEDGKKIRGKGGDKKVSLTISMGLSDSSASSDIKQIIKLADDALYSAKKAGRNCLKLNTAVDKKFI